MDKDSKFTRDEDGYVAVRTVSAPYSSGSDDKDSMFTRDADGYVAVRVTSSGGSGGDQHNLGYYATESALTTAHPTAEAGDWAIVGATDTVWVWDTDNEEWVDSDQKGQVTSVNNQTGDVTITGADILPTQTGNAGKFLVTNGTSAGWSNTISNNSNSVSSLTLNNAATGGYKPFLKCNNAIGNLLLYGYGTSGFCISTNNPLRINKGIIPGDSPADLGFSDSLSQTVTKWNCVYTDKISSAYNKFVTVPSVNGKIALQIDTLPTAASSYEGTIYQFTGTTDSTYTNGHFYKCVSDGQTPATYSWEEISFGGGLPSQTGNAGKFLVTDGTDASWGNTIGSSIKITKLNDQNKYASWFCDTDYLSGSAVCMLPYSSDGQRVQLGKSNYYFSNIFTQKIQNPGGGAITVPSVAGELAVKQVNTTITLTSAGWSSNAQMVNVTGMTATGLVFVSPDPTDQSAYTNAGIICSAQAAGTLTFTCTTTPSADIDVNVVML